MTTRQNPNPHIALSDILEARRANDPTSTIPIKCEHCSRPQDYIGDLECQACSWCMVCGQDFNGSVNTES